MDSNSSIKSKFINGVIWGVIEKFASLFAGFVVTLVLARILTPEDYGLVNMIYIFTVLGTVLLDGGFGQALIQRKNITTVDISSVFYINLVLSAVLYAILFLCAPLIANFYHQESLISISRIVFLTIPINAFCIVQHTLLTKELKVKELTYVSIISSIVSGVIGIALAYMDYGVWALVCQTVSYQLARSVALWSFSQWRPILKFSFSFIKSIFNFSMNLLGVFTLAAIFQNIYTLLIGRLYNVAEVGYYNQAFRMQSIASTAITSSIQRVTFPAFAEFQNDLTALRAAYKKVTIVTMSFYLPVMICLVVVSKSLFEVLLTAKWLPSVPMFCILCIAEAFYPLNNINAIVLKALGHGKKYLTLNIVNYSVIMLCILATYKYSLIFLLIGYAISSILRSIISMVVCGQELDYHFIEQIKELTPVFLQTIIVCSIAFLCNLLSFSPGFQLLTSISVGFIAFITIHILGKSEMYIEIKKIIKK